MIYLDFTADENQIISEFTMISWPCPKIDTKNSSSRLQSGKEHCVAFSSNWPGLIHASAMPAGCEIGFQQHICHYTNTYKHTYIQMYISQRLLEKFSADVGLCVTSCSSVARQTDRSLLSLPLKTSNSGWFCLFCPHISEYAAQRLCRCFPADCLWKEQVPHLHFRCSCAHFLYVPRVAESLLTLCAGANGEPEDSATGEWWSPAAVGGQMAFKYLHYTSISKSLAINHIEMSRLTLLILCSLSIEITKNWSF